ncbi:MAG: hypothetical protein J0I99_05235 [Devosia sp.]|uniref:hypothetical protein n=1 Tax=Devosia sp. TaxID=1871048 RepID=UPI001AD4FEEB|nr:hypothetical protein [Devosia sp.]MBN9315120.1 hypothetical protein [Devosia sp.]
MQTISELFDTFEHATAAVHALHQAGISHADISLVANTPPDYERDDVGDDATAGAEIGAGLGAAGGLMAGLGIIAIPGLGPVVAGGWLFATAVGSLAGASLGAATGGLVGALTSAGVPEANAHALVEGVRGGGAIVTARVDEAHAGPATAILRHAPGSRAAIPEPTEPSQEGQVIEEVEHHRRPEPEPEPRVPPIV